MRAFRQTVSNGVPMWFLGCRLFDAWAVLQWRMWGVGFYFWVTWRSWLFQCRLGPLELHAMNHREARYSNAEPGE